MRFKMLFGILIALIIVGLLFAYNVRSASLSATRPIVVAVLPDEEESVLRTRYDELIRYLEEQTNRNFELLIPDNYGHLVDLFEKGTVDLAYFGGLTFVQAQARARAEPLVMREVDTRFTTTFIVRNEAPWNSCVNLACADLAGKIFSFGSRLSTSGHLMPRFFLEAEHDLIPETYFGEVRYSGAHDKTAVAVSNGTANVGAMNSAILQSMISDGRLGENDLIKIWQTPPYADYVWATRSDLENDAKTSLRNAFLKLDRNGTEGDLLDALQANEFIPATTRDFETLTEIALETGLLDAP